jgi:hypothetical protein
MMKTIRIGLAVAGILCAGAAFADTSHHAKTSCAVKLGEAPIAARSADCRNYRADTSTRFETQNPNKVDSNTISAGFR